MEDNRSGKIAKNTLFLYIRMVLVLLINLYTSRVLLQVLGIEDFGIFNLVGGVVVFLSFFQSALSNATYRFLAFELGLKNYDKLNRVYSMAVNCHLLLALILWIIMEIGGVWFINTHLNIPETRVFAANWLYQFSLLSFAFSIIRTPYNSNIIAHEKMNFYALISIVESVLKLAVLYMLLISPFDRLIVYGFLLSLVAFIVLLIYASYCAIKLKEVKYKKCWDQTLFKQLVSYSGWSLFVNSADMLTTQSISIFFNWFIGIIANAAIGIMNQVNAGLSMFVSNFSQAFNPQLIKSYAAKEYDYFMRLIISTSKISYILYIIVAVPIATNIHFVLGIWLGDYPPLSADFILATLVYYMVDSMQSPLFNAIHATGKIKVHHLLVGILKLLAIPGMYVVLRLGYGGVEALVVWSISNILVGCARTIYMHYLIHLDLRVYVYRVVMPLLAITAVVGLIEYWIVLKLGESFLSLLLNGVSGLLLTFVLAYVFLFDSKERALLMKMPILNKIKHD